MKSKKILGLLLAFSLGFSVLPGKAFAEAPKQEGKSVEVVKYVEADFDAIVEMLIREGKIDANASQEEIIEATRAYLSGNNDNKLSGKGKKKFEDTQSKIKILGIKSEKNASKSMSKGKNLEVPQQVQAENHDGTSFVAKPLVILMEFPNYLHDKMSSENLRFKFDNYDTNHFQTMLFNEGTFKGPNDEDFITMKQYYTEQSGGSYTVDGKAAGWYQAKHDAIYYGEELNKNTHDRDARSLVVEAVENVAADPSINLADFDIEDRYDIDGDGNYFEPDGVIDHIIVIHAGLGQEQGGGTLGSSAIWSHRYNLGQKDLEVTDHKGDKWKANDYTMQPQSGAVGVFAHEYGHDLGLPDEYDTQYTGNGEPVGTWSIMSGGSWAGDIGGTMPTGFSPWCKEFLQTSMPNGNWSKGAKVNINDIPKEGITYLIDEAATKGVNNDVVRIDLPAYKEVMIEPIEGEQFAFSDKGNDLDTNMQLSVDLTGKTEATLKFKTAYEIEGFWDWASVSVRVNGTEDWTVIPGNITTTDSEEGAIITIPNGITGSSDGWKDAEFDLSSYAGQNIDIMFRYQTDPGLAMSGWFIDELKVTSGAETLYNENFEETPAVQFNGFKHTDGLETFNHYYLVEWRSHNGVDEGLKYAKGSLAYDPGMVVWYVNNDKYTDNWTGRHPGAGFVGVVDSDQQGDFGEGENKLYYTDTSYRIHDAAFGLNETTLVESVKVGSNKNGVPILYTDKETFMNPYFADNKDYSNYPNGNAGNAHGGLILKNLGLKIYVTGQSKDMSVGRIHIMRDSE